MAGRDLIGRDRGKLRERIGIPSPPSGGNEEMIELLRKIYEELQFKPQPVVGPSKRVVSRVTPVPVYTNEPIGAGQTKSLLEGEERVIREQGWILIIFAILSNPNMEVVYKTSELEDIISPNYLMSGWSTMPNPTSYFLPLYDDIAGVYSLLWTPGIYFPHTQTLECGIRNPTTSPQTIWIAGVYRTYYKGEEGS